MPTSRCCLSRSPASRRCWLGWRGRCRQRTCTMVAGKMLKLSWTVANCCGRRGYIKVQSSDGLLHSGSIVSRYCPSDVLFVQGQAALCIQCLYWVHQSDWPAASRRFPTSQHPQWLLLSRHSYIYRTMCHCRWTIIYLTTLVITRITYCTVSFLHLQQLHKTTIFDSELTANNYCNILDIWLTPIL